jgi:hypothetical protein
MKVAKISDLTNLADGSIIGEMSVQVKAAFPPKTGEGKYGPWRVQACILKDSTGESRASFWTDKEMKNYVGQTVTLKSQATTKGLQGLSVKYSKHSDSNELNVSEKVEIIDSMNGAEQQYTAAVKTNASLAAGQGGGTPADAKRLVFQRAQLYVQCAAAAKWAAEQAGITAAEEIQAVRASIFISADKANLFNCFPTAAAKPEPAVAEVPDEIFMGKEVNDFEAEAGW